MSAANGADAGGEFECKRQDLPRRGCRMRHSLFRVIFYLSVRGASPVAHVNTAGG